MLGDMKYHTIDEIETHTKKKKIHLCMWGDDCTDVLMTKEESQRTQGH